MAMKREDKPLGTLVKKDKVMTEMRKELGERIPEDQDQYQAFRSLLGKVVKREPKSEKP